MRVRLLALSLLLAACGGSESTDKPAPSPAAPADTASGEIPAAPDPRAEPTDPDTPTPEEPYTSVYTDLDLDACEVLEESEIGGFVDLRCEGYRGFDLFVSDGDARMDVDVGVPNDVWTSQSGFNSVGETVEWRLKDGRPIAIIIRYTISRPGGDGTSTYSELAVISIGRPGDPGCLVGWVEGNAQPSQNEAARILADGQAETIDCSAQA